VCAAALLAWLAAIVGLRAATSDVASSTFVLDGSIPAVLYAPRDPARAPLPVAILCHDFAGNAGQMGYLARQLARAGWAALALDLRGHGRNAAPFDYDGSNRALAREVEAALDWVAGRAGELDPARIALVGHGMGARVALQQAQWNPSGVAAVIALAPPSDVSGPYPPPSTLLLWGNRDLPSVRHAGRAIGARLAGRAQIRGAQTYGDPARGDAVRIDELTGPGHWSVLWSQVAAAGVLDWLAAAAGDPAGVAGAATAPSTPAARAEGALGWAALGWLAALVLLWELPRALGSLWLPALDDADAGEPRSVLVVGAALLASALILSATSAAALLEPLPLVGAREPLALLALSGSAALILARARSGAALRRAGTWLGAAALAASLYALLGPLLVPWLDPWPAPHRLTAVLLASAAALPHFAALECLLRARTWPGHVLPAAMRLLAVALLAGASLVGWLPDASLTAARYLLLGAPLLELLALRCARIAPNPWTSAIAQSLWVGWVLGALFPLAV
jgi:alpha-beta hydrolase superfamily lysophospholipase